ncbi:MAG: hypothetical protein AB7F86_09730 [Bdellovibrionales bacterium]
MNLAGVVVTGPDGQRYRLTRIGGPVRISNEAYDMNMSPTQLKKTIEAAQLVGQFSGRKLAKEAEISHLTVIGILNGRKKRVNKPTVLAILRALRGLVPSG